MPRESTIYLVDNEAAPTLFIDVLGRVATRIEDVTNEEFAQSAGLMQFVTKQGCDIDTILPIRVEEMQDGAKLKRKIDDHFKTIYYPSNAKVLDVNFDPPVSEAQAQRVGDAYAGGFILILERVFAHMGIALFESKQMEVPEDLQYLIKVGKALAQRLPEDPLTTDADLHHYLMGYEECLANGTTLPDIGTTVEMGRLIMAQQAADITLREVTETFTSIRGEQFKDRQTPQEIAILERFNAGLGRIEPEQRELFDYTAFNAMILLGTNPAAHLDSIIIERDHPTHNVLGMHMAQHYGRPATIAISGKSLLFEDKAFGDLTIAEEVGHYLDKISGSTTHNNEAYNFSYLHCDLSALSRDLVRLGSLRQEPDLEASRETITALEVGIAALPEDSYLRRSAANVAAAEGREEVTVAREQFLKALSDIHIMPGYESLTGLLGREDLEAQEMLGIVSLASEWMIKLSAYRQLLVGSEGQGRAQADALIDIALPPATRTVEYVEGEPTPISNLCGLLKQFKAEIAEAITEFKAAREEHASRTEPRSTAGDSSTGINDVAHNERRDTGAYL